MSAPCYWYFSFTNYIKPVFSLPISLIHSENLFSLLNQALQRTLEFEEELASKFGAGTEKSRSKESTNDDEEIEEDDEANDRKRIAEIRNRYQKKDASTEPDAKAQMVCEI